MASIVTSGNSNSYGIREIPEGALYGVYDNENGEWVGIWFSSWESAEQAQVDMDADPEQEHLSVESVEEDE